MLSNNVTEHRLDEGFDQCVHVDLVRVTVKTLQVTVVREETQPAAES